MNQTTIENIVAKVEIAHNEQFLTLQQGFQLYSKTNILYKEIFHIFPR